MSSEYFLNLQHDLKRYGTGLPQLILDQQRFLANLKLVKQQFKDQIYPRLVVKSLANIQLLQQAMTELQTKRLMVFHLPQLVDVLHHFPDADILMGKPMPIRALEHFYHAHPHNRQANIQWLIDDVGRLNQYLAFAQQQQIHLKINIEIDVGLHRGGVQSSEMFLAVLKKIVQYPQQLQFSGLMGYDAHVVKLPKIIKKPQDAFAESQDIYQSYQELILKYYPELWHEGLCFNGGGSPTLLLHTQKSVCNDVAFGSVLLKPSDFDLESLTEFQPALWLAIPVLKVIQPLQIPALELLSKLPIKQKAVFIYGGYWLADYVYPIGLKPHALYGRSSNQELLSISTKIDIHVDDYVIARPKQSEAILPQFAHLYCYQQHQLLRLANMRE